MSSGVNRTAVRTHSTQKANFALSANVHYHTLYTIPNSQALRVYGTVVPKTAPATNGTLPLPKCSRPGGVLTPALGFEVRRSRRNSYEWGCLYGAPVNRGAWATYNIAAALTIVTSGS
eukprot:scaffold5479_cov199-Amphora_coffeaeformis.AAC.101